MTRIPWRLKSEDQDKKWQLLWPAWEHAFLVHVPTSVCKSCVPSCQKHTWKTSSVLSNVFGVLCLKCFVPGVETHVRSFRKSVGMPLDQALFYIYYVSITCYSFLFPKKGKKSPEVKSPGREETLLFQYMELVSNSLYRKEKVCVSSACFWSFRG